MKLKKNIFTIATIGILLLSCFVITPVADTTPPSPQSNTTLYVGGSGPGNYSSIQDAIDNVSNGDTVYVYSRVYYENIVINKTINLIGEYRDTTIIYGDGIGNAVEIIADNVNISGFTVRHPGPIAKSLKYAEIEEGENFYYYTYNDVIEYYNTRFSPEGSCKLITCALCFYQGGSIVNTNEGIDVIVWDDNGNGYPGTERARINVPASDIKWIENDEWTEVNFSSYDLVFTDDFHIGFGTVDLNEDYYAIVIDNTTVEGINRSSYYAYGGWYPEVDPAGPFYYNYLIMANVTYSGIGINITDSDRSIINNSLITRCEKGIVINDSCNNNKIYHNNLINNAQNAYGNGVNTWNDSYPSGGNYWDDYTGVDNYQGPNQNVSGSDGIGDTPYYILPGTSKIPQDRYPLMEPYGQGGVTFNISVTDESPDNNSVNVSIYKQNVSAYICITQLTVDSSNFAFAWEIGGDNITMTENLADHAAGRKEAPIHDGPLEYNTTYDWYVNVSFGGQYKNVTFNFTTEKQLPVANFTWTINDLTVTFASTSTDPDNDIVNWTWNFGDGNSSYGEIIPHIYAQNGTYYVNLTVRDSGGKTNSTIKAINVINNPPVADFVYALVGGSKHVRFDASNSSDVNGTIVSYFWEFGDGKNSTDIIPIVGHDYDRDYTTYKVNLTVTDRAGLTNTISKNVTIGDVTNPTIKIVKPVKKGIYINNVYKRQRLLGMTLIIGDITIEVSATDENGSGIKEVKFYGGLRGTRYLGNDTTAPYSFNWAKGFKLIHVNQLIVKAYDGDGNSATAKILLRKYL